MKKNEKIKYITIELENLYPDVSCELLYEKPHELLISTRLSAQCTDKRVNLVTPALFLKFPDIDAFAKAEISEVEEFVKSCGIGKTKARDIVLACQMIRDVYNGVIPDTIDEIIKLPGIGRKSANLIIGELYKKPAVVTDTHVIRLSGRLNLVNSKEPLKVEQQLRKLLLPEESLDFCHRLVWHGRRVCSARSPKCGICTLNEWCAYI